MAFSCVGHSFKSKYFHVFFFFFFFIIETKCGFEELDNGARFDDSDSPSESEDAIEVEPAPSVRVQTLSPSRQSPDPVVSTFFYL